MLLLLVALPILLVPPVMSMIGPVMFNLNFAIISNIFFLPMRVTSGSTGSRNLLLDTLCNTKEAVINLNVVYRL
jgi:hypothetical protein